MSSLPFAVAAQSLLRAARRADERGDTVERDTLLGEVDEQIGLMIEAMPFDQPRLP